MSTSGFIFGRQGLVEARSPTSVARRSGGSDQEQDGVAVAVVVDGSDDHDVARGLAFLPELFSFAAP